MTSSLAKDRCTHLTTASVVFSCLSASFYPTTSSSDIDHSSHTLSLRGA
jgi:hypothetical protein